ncbi:MAG: amylo-alpha-1,6-glucosidase [Gemmatimonadales bacterium]
MTDQLPPLDAEWLETDGLGGFASGTVAGFRTRRYHAVLMAATTPPTGRIVLVPGFDAWLEESDGRRHELTLQRYAPDHASGTADHIAAFSVLPWPTWVYRAGPARITQELIAVDGQPTVLLRWTGLGVPQGARLVVRPFLAPRDLHALHAENPAFRFDADTGPGLVRWQPYPGLPAVTCRHDGEYRHDPVWYRRFQLDEERARGFDCIEDAGAPGAFAWDFGSRSEAVMVLSAADDRTPAAAADLAIRDAEARRRAGFATRLHRAADQYLVRRGTGRTIVAGYPWFTDWGRDTFIAMRGLCLATGRLDDAGAILTQWAGAVSDGMLPNRFVDQGDEPEFNSVDASLWYIVAAGEYLDRCRAERRRLRRGERAAIEAAIVAILEGYSAGTRFGIRQDTDGLLACGVRGQQLTWMDARIGDWVVTPRIGKPVEVQALWINALRIGARIQRRWGPVADLAHASFQQRFWNGDTGMLNDIVDVDHRPGLVDPTVRPNQIFAIGGLPIQLIEGARAARVVGVVTSHLLTRIGLRSLAPRDPAYAPHYEGGPRERDAAYHQGTVWPWLLGPFVEAWLRTSGDTDANRAIARHRFLEPLEAHLDQAGLGHVSEIADADPPYQPRGCPFQAWSVGEMLRIIEMTRPLPPAGGFPAGDLAAPAVPARP